jgi:uncharacterized protein
MSNDGGEFMSEIIPVRSEPRAFHVMTKPIGPICNLDCKYCFYLEKEKLFPGSENFRMTDAVLEQYVRQYIEQQDVPEISFAWQGGEPTLMGVRFFRRVVELQKKYCPEGKRVTNAFQTNGVLLDDEWGEFLHENNFLVGISFDGPREIHDRYRVDKSGKPTYDRVLTGLRVLQKHKVEYNILCVVNRLNSQHPLEVYRHFKELGAEFMQFIPLVERAGTHDMFAEPPKLEGGELPSPVTGWSVEAPTYGQFLCAIWDEWIRHDVGRIFVQMFEVQLGVWMGMPASLCVFAETCGRAMAMEHNGDLFSCDHYVYPQYKLGNVMEKSIEQMVDSEQQRRFGADKKDKLPKYCRECDVRFACNGECPKHRFMRTPDNEPGLNYLCSGYKKFFHHIDRDMKVLMRLVQSGRQAAEIMPWIRAQDEEQRHRASWETAGRNDPCPCGSGKKFKACCWDKTRAR